MNQSHDYFLNTWYPTLQAAYPGANVDYYIPGSNNPWYFSDPLWFDMGGVAIRGDSTGATGLRAVTGRNVDCFALAIPRTFVSSNSSNATRSVHADNFIDLFNPGGSPWMDSSVWAANGLSQGAGTMYGYRAQSLASTAANASLSPPRTGDYLAIAFKGTSFDRGLGGDGWSSTTMQKGTIDFYVDTMASVGVAGQFAMGCCDVNGGGCWVIQSSAGSNGIIFAPTLSNGSRYQYVAGMPVVAYGPTKWSIQYDLTASPPTVQMYAGGTQCTVSKPNGDPPSGLTIARNYYFPFRIFGVGDNCNLNGANINGFTGPFDGQIFGFKWDGNTNTYKNLGSGVAQARVDNATITDATRFCKAAKTICCLGLTDKPGDRYNNRLIHGWAGQGQSIGFGINQVNGYFWNQGFNNFLTSGYSIKDLSINMFAGYGTAVTWGTMYDSVVERVSVGSGAVHFGCQPSDANYKLKFLDCKSQTASDTSFSFYTTSATIRGTRVLPSGNSMVRGVRSVFSFDDTFSDGENGGSGHLETFVRMHGGTDGGICTIRDFTYDGEGATTPSVAGFRFDKTDSQTDPNVLMESIRVGTVGPSAPLVQLTSAAGSNRGVLTLKNVSLILGKQYGAIVQTDTGTGWIGTVEGVEYNHNDFQSAPLLATTSGDGRCGIRAVHPIDGPAPPDRGSHLAQATWYDVVQVQDGLVSRWGVCVSGKVGSSTPPQFYPAEVRQSAPGVLAAWSRTSTYATATALTIT